MTLGLRTKFYNLNCKPDIVQQIHTRLNYMTLTKSEQRLLDEQLLADFLQAWPIEDLRDIPLEKYVSIGDKNTFCQFVETITRPLGSIKGMNSIKFGIYKRGDTSKQPKKTVSNANYSWAPRYNNVNLDEDLAFQNVIEEIAQIANYSYQGNFEPIGNLGLPSLFRWKVAFLYSNNRLIPIFSKENLKSIVIKLGMENVNKKTSYFEMQQFLIPRKPIGITPVEFMRILYDDLRLKVEKHEIPGKKRRKRKASSGKSLGEVKRKGSKTTVTQQPHNTIQMRLYHQLCLEHTKSCVHLEKDWVDLMVELPKKVILFEIKHAAYAEDCFKVGIGQLLIYAYQAEKKYDQPIELIISGASEPTFEEIELIKFIRKQIKFPISYLQII